MKNFFKKVLKNKKKSFFLFVFFVLSFSLPITVYFLVSDGSFDERTAANTACNQSRRGATICGSSLGKSANAIFECREVGQVPSGVRIYDWREAYNCPTRCVMSGTAKCAAPSVSISASRRNIKEGEKTTITYSASPVTYCRQTRGSSDWMGFTLPGFLSGAGRLSKSYSVNPAQPNHVLNNYSVTYGLRCGDHNVATKYRLEGTAFVAVNVQKVSSPTPPPPTPPPSTPTPPPPSPGPGKVSITRFDVRPSRITLGQTATVSWASSNATVCRSVTPAGASRTLPSTTGSSTVQPTNLGTGEYTLVCENSGSSATSKTRIEVVSSSSPTPPPPSPPPPEPEPEPEPEPPPPPPPDPEPQPDPEPDPEPQPDPEPEPEVDCVHNGDCSQRAPYEICFEGSCLMGDVNNDGIINMLDFIEFRKDFISFKEKGWSSSLRRSDMNRDNRISMADYSIFVRAYREVQGLD